MSFEALISVGLSRKSFRLSAPFSSLLLAEKRGAGTKLDKRGMSFAEGASVRTHRLIT